MKSVLMKAIMFALVFAIMPIGSSGAFWDDHGFEISYGTPDIRVDDLALEIRDVPIHDDDGYASKSNSGPIEQTNFKTAGTAALTWLMRKNIGETTRAGLKVNWIVYPEHNTYDNALRNYTNHPGTEKRGYGAALTFAGIEKRGIIPSHNGGWLNVFTNISPELFLEKLFSEKKEWSVGASIGYFKFQAVNGWDRYDRLEINKTYALAHVVPVAAFIKRKIGGSGYSEIGVKFPIAKMTDIGKESGAKVSPSGYIAAGAPW